MKKFLIAIIAIIMLAACSTNDGEQETASEENQSLDKSEEQDEAVSEEDQTLDKPGEKVHDPAINSDVELISIVEPDDTIELGTVDMTIEDIKILKMSNIKDQELLSVAKELDKEDSISYVQINYTIENKGDESARLNSPIDTLVFDTGEQVEGYENGIINDENFARTIYEGVVSESMVAIVIEKSNPEDIKQIDIVTGRIDNDGGGTIAEPEKISYDLNK